LREDPLAGSIPVIFLSAMDRDADKSAAFEKGAAGYLVKPIEINDIVARIEKALEGK
jgi:two-component system KDP operon response regulator KdpE